MEKWKNRYHKHSLSLLEVRYLTPIEVKMGLVEVRV
jgi:hypothetical protein